MLEELPELREALLMLADLLYKDMIEDTDERPDGRKAQGKVCGQGPGAYAFSERFTLSKSLCVEPHPLGCVQRLPY